MNMKSISHIVLGTDYYGKTIPEQTAVGLLDKFYGSGGRIIDTAHVYSDYLPGEKHMSEKVIGRWLRSTWRDGYLNAADRPYIATKGGFPVIGDMHASRISYGEIRSDLEESLECLGIDCIDMYWLHRDNTHVDAGEITEWMNGFIREGVIKNYGYSNWKAARIKESVDYASAHNLKAPAASQIRWSLAVTRYDMRTDDTVVEMDADEYSWYSDNRFTVFAFSSQAKGFFSKLKRINGGYEVPPGKAGQRYADSLNFRTYDRLCEICGKYDMTPAQGALSWLMHAPFPVFPIIGCSSESQLSECMNEASCTSVREFADQSAIFHR